MKSIKSSTITEYNQAEYNQAIADYFGFSYIKNSPFRDSPYKKDGWSVMSFFTEELALSYCISTHNKKDLEKFNKFLNHNPSSSSSVKKLV